MKISLRPTTQFHQIAVAEEGDRPYARLWQGVTENGEHIQALVFGIACEDKNSVDAMHLVDDAKPLGKHRPEVFPPCVIARRVTPTPAGKKAIN